MPPTPLSSPTLSALFPDRDEADAAAGELRALGLGADIVAVTPADRHPYHVEEVPDPDASPRLLPTMATGVAVGVLFGALGMWLALPLAGTEIDPQALVPGAVFGAFAGAFFGALVALVTRFPIDAYVAYLREITPGARDVLMTVTRAHERETIQAFRHHHGRLVVDHAA